MPKQPSITTTVTCEKCKHLTILIPLYELNVPYWMKIFMELNFAIWVRMVKFTELNIREFIFLNSNYKSKHWNNKQNINLANLPLQAKFKYRRCKFFTVGYVQDDWSNSMLLYTKFDHVIGTGSLVSGSLSFWPILLVTVRYGYK